MLMTVVFPLVPHLPPVLPPGFIFDEESEEGNNGWAVVGCCSGGSLTLYSPTDVDSDADATTIGTLAATRL
jgi:hypothetical protein